MSSTVNFYLRKSHPKKNGECSIHIRVTINRKPHYINLKEHIHPNYWKETSESEKIKSSHPRARLLNIKLRKAYNRVNEIIDELDILGVPLNFDTIQKKFTGVSNDSFFKFIKEELDQRYKSKNIAYGTYRCDLNRLDRIKEFNPNITFRDLTLSYLHNLQEWLMYDEGNNRNTANKKLSFIRTYIKRAIDKDLMKENPFGKMTLSYEPTKKEVLDDHEIQKLQTILDEGSLPSKLHNVLHVFLIACYTGFRFSDYAKFNNYKGEEQYTITMSKTKEKLTIPIIKQAKHLLLGQFHIVSNQKMNVALKEIMKFAEIDKQITTHSARHSFAIRLICKGANLKDIQSLLGHKDYRSTLVYASFVPMHRLEEVIKKIEI